jgi:hypothetical protein
MEFLSEFVCVSLLRRGWDFIGPLVDLRIRHGVFLNHKLWLLCLQRFCSKMSLVHF